MSLQEKESPLLAPFLDRSPSRRFHSLLVLSPPAVVADGRRDDDLATFRGSHCFFFLLLLLPGAPNLV